LSFTDFSLFPELQRSIRDCGYHDPTPVQSETIPVALEGRDLVVSAETGSGKTAAFLIPLIDRLHRKHAKGPSALVIAPTRELAAQCGQEFTRLARHCGLRAAVIVGGESMRRQIDDLRAGAQVLIVCPGRLIDLMEQGKVSLTHVQVVVIDEADRLLDMGFLPQLRRVMRTLPKERQTMMFSATMGSGPEAIARDFLHHPERIMIGGRKSAPPPSISQTIYPVQWGDKEAMLLEILGKPEVQSAIVFTRTRVRAEHIGRMLKRHGMRTAVIHGDRSQAERNTALKTFKAGTCRIMVATDVAARGLDIPGVSHVVNYDLPEDAESYIHRIGRTARMGREGEAISLVTPQERVSLGQIERALGEEIRREQVEGFETPEVKAPKPVKLFRSSAGRARGRSRSRW
jgi:ATP-dependent RNA helicase RhlE